jgi:hypothetical protein
VVFMESISSVSDSINHRLFMHGNRFRDQFWFKCAFIHLIKNLHFFKFFVISLRFYVNFNICFNFRVILVNRSAHSLDINFRRKRAFLELLRLLNLLKLFKISFLIFC